MAECQEFFKWWSTSVEHLNYRNVAMRSGLLGEQLLGLGGQALQHWLSKVARGELGWVCCMALRGHDARHAAHDRENWGGWPRG